MINPPFMGARVGLSAEEEIAQTVIGSILPSLRTMLEALTSLSQVWNTPGNDIPAKIMAAAQAGQPLAGYSPNTWAEWGQVFLAVEEFLDTPTTVALPDGSTLNTTPRAALQKRYVQAQA
jgi:hypothetical protein